MVSPAERAADQARCLEYVIPLRWDTAADTTHVMAEMRAYLGAVAAVADVTVVDGSPPGALDLHRAWWESSARILPPGPWPGRNGKVAGVVTGVLAARHNLVVIADDDVRYRPEQLREMAARLAGCDVVKPQNIFVTADTRLPWHARWDTGRTLLNRAVGGDHPGTFGLRRDVFVAVGGYDGDVLFENLQMLRTMRAGGARIDRADGMYVARLPPTARQFWGQRIRQAYDDFGQPARLAFEASWLPLAVLAALKRPRALLVAALTAVGLAEYGRRRHDGATVFPATGACWAPVWAAERSVCVWIAIIARCRGGIRYRGERLRHATRPVLRQVGSSDGHGRNGARHAAGTSRPEY